jgi:hypothetical protein
MMLRLASFFSRRAMLLSLCVALLLGSAFAQDAPPKPVISPHARLIAARTIYIEHAGGRLPNDVIGDAFQGWGHFRVVYDPADADLIVSIAAPVSDGGVSVSGRADDRGAASSRNVSPATITQIRLLILDAHDRVVLWSGNEQPKSAMKGKQREDNEVEASLRLFRRFRNVIEPEPAPDK